MTTDHTDTAAMRVTWRWFLDAAPDGFRDGYADAVAGRRFRYDFGPDEHSSWNYEQGHKLGALLHMRGKRILWRESERAPPALFAAVKGLRGDG